MAPRCQNYTLVGFAPELDWKALKFVKPLPPNRVCSACNLVRAKSALLPCVHTLCVSCYEQCGQDGPHLCPIGRCEFEEEDVEWRDFPVQELLKREVKCWNEGTGCRRVVAVSGIVHHFLRECEHHCISCPKCSATVLCSDVVAHMKSTICTTQPNSAIDCDVPVAGKNEATLFTEFKSTFQKQVEEVKYYLREIVGDVRTHGDRRNEISHGVNGFKETLIQELASASKKIEDNVARSSCDASGFKEEVKECLTKSMDIINCVSGNLRRLEETKSDVLANVTGQTRDISKLSSSIDEVEAATNENGEALNHIKLAVLRYEQRVTHWEFFVKNMNEFVKTAMRHGSATYDSEKVYLRGYCLAPEVQFTMVDELVKLGVRLRLRKGEMDDFVQWPFKQTIKLSIIHPTKDFDWTLEMKASGSPGCYEKPTTNYEPARLVGDLLDLNDLISGGYIEHDRLRIKLQLLP